MQNIWHTWHEIKTLAQGKKGIKLYGRSEDWVHKAQKSLKDVLVDGIVDRNPDYKNTTYLGLEVGPFEEIKNPSDYYLLLLESL